MFGFAKTQMYPIGVDIGDGELKCVQLIAGTDGLALVSAGIKNRPDDIENHTAAWQKWAISNLKEIISEGGFHGRQTVSAMPADEILIEHIKKPKVPEDQLDQAIISKIEQKLKFDSKDAVVKYIPMENDNILTMATQREKVERFLAVYEQANLHIKAIESWPTAMINTYVRFFGRRESDLNAVVCLLEIKSECTNFVVCRHKNPLYARSIPVGTNHLHRGRAEVKLMTDIEASREHFSSMYNNVYLERVIFISQSKRNINNEKYFTSIAKTMDLPAQIGDCLKAADRNIYKIKETDRQINWATALGLSLS